MPLVHDVIELAPDVGGGRTELHVYRIGPEGGRKVYLQAALHADEQPGTMVLHHLLPLLEEADHDGRLRARFTIIPSVNPLGLQNFSFRQHLGRYDANSGVNFNRRWPDLFVVLGEEIAHRLTNDAAENLATIRSTLATWISNQQLRDAAAELRLAVLRECHDADIVLDLHCDDESLIHIFTSDDMMPGLSDLGAWMGAAAILTANDSGGGSFDEMLPQLYRRLAAAHPDKPMPAPVPAATLEYRGSADVFDRLGIDDAERLFGFLAERGFIEDTTVERPQAAFIATSLAATEMLRVDRPGIVAYQVELGERVTAGQVVAELIVVDGPDAFRKRVPIRAGTDGFVLSRRLSKYNRRGESIAKIVGTEPLPDREDYLLED